MKNKEDIALSSILKKTDPERSEHLKSFLSDEQKSLLEKVPHHSHGFFLI